MSKKVYLAGDMLTRGSQLQRAEEAQMVRDLGHMIFNPMEAEHNDKANTVQEGLAERIVANDTRAIQWSDTVIIEPLIHAVGTCIELGQVKGMRDVSKEIMEEVKFFQENADSVSDVGYLIKSLEEICNKHIDRKVYPHYEDIRRDNISEQSGDRREFGMHQYIYGVCLDLTNGKGMYTIDEIREELTK